MATATNGLITKTASYPGTCGICLTRFGVGTMIDWNPITRATFHADEDLCLTLHQASAIVADPVFDAMMDDDREMAMMEMANDREQSAREGDWMNSLDAMTDAGMDLAAIEREAEEEMEHRMNCDDQDCLRRERQQEVDEMETLLTREYEALLDRIDDCLLEYREQVRAQNVKGLSRGTYRVELSGKRDTDPVNVTIAPNPRDPESFRFGTVEDGGIGRVTGKGSVYLWPSVDGNDPRVKRALVALDVLLGSETPGAFGLAYARMAGVCYRCGLPLTREESIDRMMGKVCARKAANGER